MSQCDSLVRLEHSRTSEKSTKCQEIYRSVPVRGVCCPPQSLQETDSGLLRPLHPMKHLLRPRLLTPLLLHPGNDDLFDILSSDREAVGNVTVDGVCAAER